MRQRQGLLESFNYAFEGIIHVLRTQRNMRIHFAAAAIVVVAALATGVSKLELIALVLTIFVVIATKAYTGRGTPLRGGLPSGHAAIGFAIWMAATFVVGDSHRFLVSSLTFISALLVAQTRVESGVHSALEVAYGGVLGALVALVVFQFFL
jgi:diacylglycerol kinase (ATP)